MLKTRLLLLLVCAIFGSLGLFLWERGFYEFAVLIPPVPMVSSFLLFLFSFFEVDRTPNGELYFKASNPYLRLMRFVFNSESLKGDQISICKLHGLSCVLTVMGAVSGFTLFVVGLLAYLFLTGLAKPDQFSWRPFLTLLGFVGGFILLIQILNSKYRWVRNVARGLVTLAMVGFVVFVLVGMPVLGIIEKYNVAILWAIAYYLGFVLGVVGAVVTVVLLVVIAVKYIPMFKNTWLGQIFLSAYHSTCPMIHLESQE